MDTTITVKTRAADIPTPLQAALTELENAMARCIGSPTAQNQKAVETARGAVDREKARANHQRREVLAAVCERQTGYVSNQNGDL